MIRNNVARSTLNLNFDNGIIGVTVTLAIKDLNKRTVSLLDTDIALSSFRFRLIFPSYVKFGILWKNLLLYSTKPVVFVDANGFSYKSLIF